MVGREPLNPVVLRAAKVVEHLYWQGWTVQRALAFVEELTDI